MESRLSGTDNRLPFGKDVIDLPIKQWARVNGSKSFGSEEIKVIDREFRIPSTSTVNVFSCSKVNRESPTICLKWCLKSFTEDSHNPSKGATSGIKCHFKRCSFANLFTSVLWSSEFSKAYNSFNFVVGAYEISAIIWMHMFRYPAPSNESAQRRQKSLRDQITHDF